MIFAAAVFSTNALADDWSWYECSVTKMGVGGGRYEFKLSGTKLIDSMPGPNTINQWFEIHPDSIQLQKEVLAIILTAVSTGKKIEVLVLPTITKSIYAVYMKI
jgi:hypothetical protein